MLTRQHVFLFLLDIKVIVDFETSNLYGHAVFSVCLVALCRFDGSLRRRLPTSPPVSVYQWFR